MQTRIFYVALSLGLLPVALLLSAGCVSTGGASTKSAVVRPELTPPVGDYYPAQAKRLGLTGRVGLEYSVDARGHAQNIVVTESYAGLLVAAPLILLGIFLTRRWQLWRRASGRHIRQGDF
jgi:hypothetical protein